MCSSENMNYEEMICIDNNTYLTICVIFNIHVKHINNAHVLVINVKRIKRNHSLIFYIRNAWQV